MNTTMLTTSIFSHHFFHIFSSFQRELLAKLIPNFFDPLFAFLWIFFTVLKITNFHLFHFHQQSQLSPEKKYYPTRKSIPTSFHTRPKSTTKCHHDRIQNSLSYGRNIQQEKYFCAMRKRKIVRTRKIVSNFRRIL